jgi:4-amino-4-deoxy-L-arabinose transferase-like glycosyltransferase
LSFSKLLACFILYFVVKACLYVAGVPPWQAPDETLHFEVAELRRQAGSGVGALRADPYLEEEIVTSLNYHDYWRLTGQIEPDPPPRTLGSSLVGQALPLYYNLAALAFRLMPTGALLAHLYCGRLISVLCGALAVLLTALAARRLFPDDAAVALGAAAAMAFLPQVGYMSGVLSPDALVLMLSSAACLLGVVVTIGTPKLRWLAFVAVIAALCLLTKRSLYFFVPLLAACPLLSRAGSRRLKAVWWVLSVGATAALLALGPIRSTATRSLHQASLHLQLVEGSSPGWWGKAALTLYRSSLASLGWLRFHAHWGWYRTMAVLLLAAMLGLSRMAIRWSWGARGPRNARGTVLTWLALVACMGAAQVALGFGLSGEELPQGRHLFPAVPALCVLLSIGLRAVLPGRGGKAVVAAAALFLLAFDVWVMWRVALPGFYL